MIAKPERWAVVPSAIWDGQSLLIDKAVIVDGERISAIVDAKSQKNITKIRFVVHRGHNIEFSQLKAMRSSLFARQPNDAITELIVGVADTKQLPKSPEVIFEN